MNFGPFVVTHQHSTPAAFIDVVAKVYDKIQVLIAHMLIGRVEALLILLTRSDGKPQTVYRCTRQWRGLCTPDWAYFTGQAPAIIVLRRRLQTSHLAMGRVS